MEHLGGPIEPTHLETTKIGTKNPPVWVDFFGDFFPRLMSEIKSSPFQHMGFKNRVFSLENWPDIFFLFGRDQCHGKKKVI